MTKKRVVLLDREEAYGIQLMEYVKEQRQYGIELLLFTRAEAFKEYLLSVSCINLLILEPYFIGIIKAQEDVKVMEYAKEDRAVQEFADEKKQREQDFAKKIKKILYLSEEKGTEDGLFRYQPMKGILGKICDAVRETKERETFLPKRNGHEIFCIFSPVGGSGKTDLSKKLAKKQGNLGRTFLFPMELFSEGYKGNEKPGFSDLIYYLKQEDAGLLEKFSQMIFREENYDSLNPGSCPMDYLYLETMEMERLLKLLLEEEGYETLIFDIGFINEAVLLLMESADHIYIPKTDTKAGTKKMEFWKESLVFMGKDELLEKQEIVEL